MSSCVVQVPALLKRERPALPVDASEAAKVGKHWSHSSPRATMEAQAQMQTQTQTQMQTQTQTQTQTQRVPWPDVRGCDGVRRALAFLHKSRQHAVLLMVQNHWERAIGVMEKIEAATESVSLQRRRVVIDQVNAALADGIQRLELRPQPAAIETPRARAVRFSPDVSVAAADAMDRAGEQLAAPQREEMLVLRASRSIPQENLSEFWDN